MNLLQEKIGIQYSHRMLAKWLGKDMLVHANCKPNQLIMHCVWSPGVVFSSTSALFFISRSCRCLQHVRFPHEIIENHKISVYLYIEDAIECSSAHSERVAAEPSYALLKPSPATNTALKMRSYKQVGAACYIHLDVAMKKKDVTTAWQRVLHTLRRRSCWSQNMHLLSRQESIKIIYSP